MRLNLGCSDESLPGWIGVDIVAPADQIADLRNPWPWPDNSVDEIRAYDVFEHLPDKIHTMNEAWRVLKPGRTLDLFVPTTDGRGAFQDPTHRSFWTPNDLFYYTIVEARPGSLNLGFERERLGAAYGITARFRVLSQEHTEWPNKVWKLKAVLEAVK